MENATFGVQMFMLCSFFQCSSV